VALYSLLSAENAVTKFTLLSLAADTKMR
jgi:hypothetical protein